MNSPNPASAAHSPSTTKRGVLTSVASSVTIAFVFFFTPFLAPATTDIIWAVRVIVIIPVIALTLVTMGQFDAVRAVIRKVRARPLVALGVFACGALISAQLLLFTWAPFHGRAMEVALGYFLLPLTLIVVGRVLYGDRLAWWQWIAAAVAAVGVAFEIVRVGAISWETLLVCLGYPVYFVLRRALGTADLGGMFWEFTAVAPFAVVVAVVTVADGTVFRANPNFWWAILIVAVVSAVSLVCFILASRYLTISLFGLLSYLEPALLIVAAMLLGEQLTPEELPIYVAIWLAVLILAAGGVVSLRSRRHRKGKPRTLQA